MKSISISGGHKLKIVIFRVSVRVQCTGSRPYDVTVHNASAYMLSPGAHWLTLHTSGNPVRLTTRPSHPLLMGQPQVLQMTWFDQRSRTPFSLVEQSKAQPYGSVMTKTG